MFQASHETLQQMVTKPALIVAQASPLGRCQPTTPAPALFWRVTDILEDRVATQAPRSL